MNVVIDTHVWIWWIEDDQRHVALARHLDAMGAGAIGLSAISTWEVALKARRVGPGALQLSRPINDWLEVARRPAPLRLLPVTDEIAIAAASLPAGAPADPADRFIIATALVHNVPLLTHDARVLAFAGVEHYRP